MESKRIMIVDDEEIVRELLDEVLQMLGYETIVMASPIKAIECFRELNATIDLVLIDMIMPEMNGDELFYHIRGINGEQKVVVLSGYSDDRQVKQLFAEGISGFIQKPITIGELSKIIEKNID